jgi:adenosylhomocysteine nucleosidase
VVAALREELQSILPALERVRGFRTGPLRYRVGMLCGLDVAIVRTGIGAALARSRTRHLIEALGPRLVLNVGFAGALREDLSTGDILIGAEGRDVGEPADDDASAARAPAAGTWRSEAGLVRLAEDLDPSEIGLPNGVHVHVGRVVTTVAVVGRPEDKRALGQRFAALAVDMESSAVARSAEERGIPFLYVRAVLDELRDMLPFDFGRILTPDGRPRPLRFLAAVAGQPGGVGKVLRLRAQSLRSVESLRAFVPELLARWKVPDG